MKNLSKKLTLYTTILLCIILGYCLLMIKESVMKMQKEMYLLNQYISYEENAIKILKAEISYLKSPARLKKIAMTHLNMDEANISHIDSIIENTNISNKKEFAIKGNISTKKAVWNKRKLNNKYLIRVSTKNAI